MRGPRRRPPLPRAACVALAAGLALLVLAALAAGCARDPALVRWDALYVQAQRAGRRGPPAHALRAFLEAADAAPTPVDRHRALFGAARALERLGRPARALDLYAAVARGGRRRQDRARARYAAARLAERLGRLGVARALYRRLVATYPELMPGASSLDHLERLAREGGPQSVDEHLRWTRERFPRLQGTPLGDNLVYFPARVAYERWIRTGDPAWAARAIGLYGRLDREYYRAGVWDDGVWDLSYLYHRMGDVEGELRALDRLLSAHEPPGFFGDFQARHVWVSALRAARLELVALRPPRPRRAAARYARFRARNPLSRWRDDAAFYEGCAWGRAGERVRMERAFAQIAGIYPDSKYLRRLEAARRDPSSAVCTPPDAFPPPPMPLGDLARASAHDAHAHGDVTRGPLARGLRVSAGAP